MKEPDKFLYSALDDRKDTSAFRIKLSLLTFGGYCQNEVVETYVPAKSDRVPLVKVMRFHGRLPKKEPRYSVAISDYCGELFRN